MQTAGRPGIHCRSPVSSTIWCLHLINPQSKHRSETRCLRQSKPVGCLAQVLPQGACEQGATLSKAPATNPLRRCPWACCRVRQRERDTPKHRGCRDADGQPQRLSACACRLAQPRQASDWQPARPSCERGTIRANAQLRHSRWGHRDDEAGWLRSSGNRRKQIDRRLLPQMFRC